jgi:hypothetical protein
METKKDPRGRKPLKDKKKSIRVYIRESQIKKLGGEKAFVKKIHELANSVN